MALRVRQALSNTREACGGTGLILGTMHLKRVISNANAKSPLLGVSKTNKGHLEALLLSLIMLKGRFKKKKIEKLSLLGRRSGVCLFYLVQC